MTNWYTVGFTFAVYHCLSRSLNSHFCYPVIFKSRYEELNMNTTYFPELPIEIANPMVSLYRLLDTKKEHSDSLGEHNSILELQLYLQNVCHLARTVYSPSITIRNQPMLERLIRRSFSLDRQLQAIAEHYEWLENTETQMMKQISLIVDSLVSENELLSN